MKEEIINDDGLEELKAIEGELLDADGYNLNDENAQKEQDYSERVEPFDRQIAGIAAMGIIGLAAYVASRRGEHWAVGEEEAEGFGIAAAKVIAFYFPDQKYTPLVELGIVTGVMVFGRVAVDVMTKKEKPKTESENVES